MKKIFTGFFLIVISINLFCKSNKRDEIVLTPEISLIDIPTAGVVDYSNFYLKSRFYNNGGFLGYMNVGMLQNFNLGVSFMIDRLIGSQTPVKMVKPELQLKYRFYDGGYYMPALAIGYDGQGFYYDKNLKKYMQKSKGVYVVGSKEVFLPSFLLSGGLNIPDYDEEYLYSFVGFSYNVEDSFIIMCEFDNLFHSDYPSRTNIGVRINISSNFSFDLALRNIGRNSKFINGEPNKTERIVQFNTSFYLSH